MTASRKHTMTFLQEVGKNSKQNKKTRFKGVDESEANRMRKNR